MSLRRRFRRRLPSLVVLASVGFQLIGGGAATARVGTKPSTQRWCGAEGINDLICAMSGSVVVTPSALPPYRASSRARVVSSDSRVRVTPRGEARITFMRQAKCTLGASTEATEIVTRFGGDGPLFWQSHGRSLCTFASGPNKKVGLFCDQASEAEGRCPVIVNTVGQTQVVTRTSNPVIMEFCSGAYAVKVADAFGGGEVSGRSSVGGRVRVTILETESNAETTIATGTETRTETAVHHSINLSASDLAGAGICASPVFRRGRREI